MQYLTYEEYIQIGGVRDIAAFSQYITRASGIISNHTKGRLDGQEIPFEVKSLCRDIVEFYADEDENLSASKSQTAGGVSESVSFSQKDEEEREQWIDDLVFDYLGSVEINGMPILYRGCAQ